MIYLLCSAALVLSTICATLIVWYRNKHYQSYIDKRVDRSMVKFSKDSFDSVMRFERAMGYAEKPMPKAHDHQRDLMDDLVFRLADDLSRGGKFARKFEETYGIKRQ